MHLQILLSFRPSYWKFYREKKKRFKGLCLVNLMMMIDGPMDLLLSADYKHLSKRRSSAGFSSSLVSPPAHHPRLFPFGHNVFLELPGCLCQQLTYTHALTHQCKWKTIVSLKMWFCKYRSPLKTEPEWNWNGRHRMYHSKWRSPCLQQWSMYVPRQII